MFLTQCYEILVNIATQCKNDRLPVRVNFILDEFSNLATIHNFENRISEARSKNVRYFLYIQSFSQLENKYKENAETLISNCNNWICFGSKEMGFLSKISEICGKELDYNGIEHYLISPSNIQYLRKKDDYTEVLILRQGLHPYVTELPDYSLTDLFVDEKEEKLIDIKESCVLSGCNSKSLYKFARLADHNARLRDALCVYLHFYVSEKLKSQLRKRFDYLKPLSTLNPEQLTQSQSEYRTIYENYLNQKNAKQNDD